MTLDERLEALTQSLELVVLRQNDAERQQAAAEERRTAAEVRQAAAEERRTAAEVRQVAAEERRTAAEVRQIAAEERHEREMAEIRRIDLATRVILRRAVGLAVREARHERSRRRDLDERIDEKITQLAAAQLITEEKMDEKITQLAAAQLVTEEKLQAFINSMRRGGNGSQP